MSKMRDSFICSFFQVAKTFSVTEDQIQKHAGIKNQNKGKNKRRIRSEERHDDFLYLFYRIEDIVDFFVLQTEVVV
jgi:hypothetical protein